MQLLGRRVVSHETSWYEGLHITAERFCGKAWDFEKAPGLQRSRTFFRQIPSGNKLGLLGMRDKCEVRLSMGTDVFGVCFGAAIMT